MEEASGKDENTASTIDIFLCHAHVDEKYQQQLERQLSFLQKNGRIRLWHNGKINPGENREQVTHAHLNTAQIVLLLISPNFMVSPECDEITKKALERQKEGKTRVIPIIVSPVVGWEDGPLGQLQALPKNGKSIRSTPWRNHDEAFLEIAKDIHHILDEIKALPPVFTHVPETGSENSQENSVPEQKPLPTVLVAKYESHQEATALIPSNDLSQISTPHLLTSVEDDTLSLRACISLLHNKRNWRKGMLLISTAIFLVLVVSLFPFFSLSTCFFTVCRPSPQPIKQPSLRHDGEIQDQNLSVSLGAVMSPSFVLTNDPRQYSGSTTPSTSIGAVSLAKNTSTYYTIVINVQNLRYEGADILIDYVALKLLAIPALPHPLRVWTPGVATTYLGYPYPVTYKGQKLGQLLYAEPSKNVILAPAGPNHIGESDPLSIQIRSTVAAYLQFQVEITYQITSGPQTLILPRSFQVVFSDASNWQNETL
jgi:hypothetical protein